MAQNPSRKNTERNRNEISPPDSGGNTKWNDPHILKMIEEARDDLVRERTGDRAKFEVAFNDADRLYRVKVEFEFSPQQFEDFAADLGRPRSAAADLLKLHGRRDDAMKWFEATQFLAGDGRVNLSWQAYARERKLIRRNTKKDQNAKSGDAAGKPVAAEIAQLTKERDNLKARVAEVERERDEAKAELDRLRSRGTAQP